MDGLPGADGARTSSWVAGIPDRRVGDVQVTVLTDVASLRAEGGDGPDADGIQGLSHCVGDYGPWCRHEGGRILSLRDARTRERLSTVELSFEGARLVVEQHRGWANGSPHARAEQALATYVEWLRENPSRVDAEALAPVPRPHGEGDLDPATAGYDPTVPGNWERVRDLWAPHLPRAVRSLDAAGFAMAAAVAAQQGRVWRDGPWGPVSGPIPDLDHPPHATPG